MQAVLAVLAFTIIVLYIPYLFTILAGKPQNFENRAVLSLAMMIRETGPRSKLYLENVYLMAVLLEIFYFSLAFLVVRNLALLIITCALVSFETAHLIKGYANLQRFFRGEIPVKDFLLWRYERLSCMFFTLHALLTLVYLFTPLS